MRSADVGSNLETLYTVVRLLNGLEAVTGALLAAWLAIEDPAHSPNAFWTTRPIGRPRLLQAKSLGAFLFFLAAPLFLLAPVWLAAGFSAPEFFAAAADWALIQGLFVALGLLAGVLSRDLGQVFIGTPLLSLALLGVSTWLRREPAPAAWWSMSLGLAVAVIGIALAYALRRRIPALAVVVAGLLLVASCGLPELPPDEHLSAWPEPTHALQVGEAQSAASRTWRFVALDYDDDERPSILLQSTRSWISLRPTPQIHESTPRFTTIEPASGYLRSLDPKRLGTVQAASLRVSRWHLALPENFKAPAGGVRLFSSPVPGFAEQLYKAQFPNGLHP
jgi:hypothetical protein